MEKLINQSKNQVNYNFLELNGIKLVEPLKSKILKILKENKKMIIFFVSAGIMLSF